LPEIVIGDPILLEQALVIALSYREHRTSVCGVI
jgi:hypothetical protein